MAVQLEVSGQFPWIRRVHHVQESGSNGNSNGQNGAHHLNGFGPTPLVLPKNSDPSPGKVLMPGNCIPFTQFYDQFLSNPSRFVVNSAGRLARTFEYFQNPEDPKPIERREKLRILTAPYDHRPIKKILFGQNEAGHHLYQEALRLSGQTNPDIGYIVVGRTSSGKSILTEILGHSFSIYLGTEEGAMRALAWRVPTKLSELHGWGGIPLDDTYSFVRPSIPTNPIHLLGINQSALGLPGRVELLRQFMDTNIVSNADIDTGRFNENLFLHYGLDPLSADIVSKLLESGGHEKVLEASYVERCSMPPNSGRGVVHIGAGEKIEPEMLYHAFGGICIIEDGLSPRIGFEDPTALIMSLKDLFRGHTQAAPPRNQATPRMLPDTIFIMTANPGVCKEFYGESDAVGKTIKHSLHTVRVPGILEYTDETDFYRSRLPKGYSPDVYAADAFGLLFCSLRRLSRCSDHPPYEPHKDLPQVAGALTPFQITLLANPDIPVEAINRTRIVPFNDRELQLIDNHRALIIAEHSRDAEGDRELLLDGEIGLPVTETLRTVQEIATRCGLDHCLVDVVSGIPDKLLLTTYHEQRNSAALRKEIDAFQANRKSTSSTENRELIPNSLLIKAEWTLYLQSIVRRDLEQVFFSNAENEVREGFIAYINALVKIASREEMPGDEDIWQRSEVSESPINIRDNFEAKYLIPVGYIDNVNKEERRNSFVLNTASIARRGQKIENSLETQFSESYNQCVQFVRKQEEERLTLFMKSVHSFVKERREEASFSEVEGLDPKVAQEYDAVIARLCGNYEPEWLHIYGGRRLQVEYARKHIYRNLAFAVPMVGANLVDIKEDFTRKSKNIERQGRDFDRRNRDPYYRDPYYDRRYYI